MKVHDRFVIVLADNSGGQNIATLRLSANL